MSWNPSTNEVISLLATPYQERYEYFVKRVASWEQVWSLKNDSGWVLAGDAKDRQVVPIWPHQAYANACATGEWSDSWPAPIDLQSWLTKWIPGLVRDARLVAVFPVPTDGGAVVTPERLQDDLEEELEKYV
jgi:hypothetical protein